MDNYEAEAIALEEKIREAMQDEDAEATGFWGPEGEL